ncbi:MAG TPA: glutamyl-tRNA reductase [Candidatus Manganitrophaceae bacterium]|nr:glutamyl-tRNA reductase [Candidatus Manganitrophaceae bacterium]
MNIITVGLNHRTAAIEIRERLSISEAQIGEALYRLKSDPLIEEGLILSTCNRVEVFAVVKETRGGLEAAKNFLLRYRPDLPEESITPCLYMYSAGESLRHLFRVASGLDSMIIGEPQILGQIKDAFDQAITHKTTGVILNKVFKKAISVAKRVRTETKISESAVSISFAAVELAKKIFGKLDQKSVLLIGAGEMAELAARHFVSNGVSSISIANRSYERALELAKEFKGVPIPFEEFIVEMAQSDIVLCSTGAPNYLIGPEEVSKVIAIRRNRPIFLIDISVPRNIDPQINKLDNVFLYDIDDLQLSVETNIRTREKEALKAEEIILEEIQRFSLWFKSLDAVPMIIALKDRAEEIRRSELEKVLGKLGALTPAQRGALEGLTASIVNKLLHSPLTVLKEEAQSTNGNMILEAAQKLFQLEELLVKLEKKKENPPPLNPT